MALAALRIAQDDPYAGPSRSRRSCPAPYPSPRRPGCRSPACWSDRPGAIGDRPPPGRHGARSMRPRPMAAGDFLFHPPPGSCSIAMPDRVTRPPAARSVTCSRRNTRRTAEPKPRAPEARPASRLLPPGRSAQQDRDPCAALPADQLVGSGDRARAVLSRCTRSGRMYATSSPSSARTVAPRRRARTRLACSRHPHPAARPEAYWSTAASPHEWITMMRSPGRGDAGQPGASRRLWRHRRQMLAGTRGRHVSWT